VPERKISKWWRYDRRREPFALGARTAAEGASPGGTRATRLKNTFSCEDGGPLRNPSEADSDEGRAVKGHRGIVLYDFLLCRGGAESVTLEMARGLPNADLCFGFRDKAHFPDPALDGLRYFDLGVRVRFSGARTLSGLRVYRKKTAFMQGYDWAIYSGYLAPEAVYSHPVGLNIYYCHTVPRFAYDLHSDYLGRLAHWQRPFFGVLVAQVRRRYTQAISRMDRIIANSENVQHRLREHLGVRSEVIYPPCDLASYRWSGQGDYYLSTARLEPPKRVNLIVKAFRQMPDKRLLVCSGGSEMSRLLRLTAGADNISFTGWVSNARLAELMGRAIATLYIPQDEDFGISPVESMAAGKPVIGVAEGGILETVVDRQTGILVTKEPTIRDIVRAVMNLTIDRAAAMRRACEERAQQFTRERFLDQMRRVISQ
jgi:glycosyltransferase involved in cell wall biosynthesis